MFRYYIVNVLAHGDPTARVQPMGAGIDIAAHELAGALTSRRHKAPNLDRGGLDTLPVVSNAAILLASLLLLDAITIPFRDPWFFLVTNLYHATLAGLTAATLLALFTRLAHRYLETQHQTLEAEMDSLTLALANVLRE